MAIDDTKLAAEIIEEADLGKERLQDMQRDDVFLDAKGFPWARGKASPMGEEHRIFALFDFEDSDWVLVYGVPAGDTYRPDAFKKWRVHRAGRQKAKDSVGIPAVISSMTLEVFRREVGEMMWAQWVAAKQRRETREAAEILQACVEEIAVICHVVIDERPGAAAELLLKISETARGALRELDLLPDEPSAPPQAD